MFSPAPGFNRSNRLSHLSDRSTFAELHKPKADSITLSKESAFRLVFSDSIMIQPADTTRGKELTKALQDKLNLNFIKVDYSVLEERALANLTMQDRRYTTNLFEETKMNAIHLLLAKNEQFKFVSVIFDTNRDISVQKQYTYKTLLDVTEGDLLVVPTAQGTFQTVKVVTVKNTFDAPFELKWVAAKLDLTHLEEVKAMEDELKSLFAEEEKRKRTEKETEQLEEYLGKKGVKKAELIAKKVRI